MITISGLYESHLTVANLDRSIAFSFAQDLVEARRAYGESATLIFDQEAGHRILFPGEATPRSTLRAHGGTDEADARLGQKAWQAIASLL